MVEDRDYMREPEYGRSKFGVRWSSLTVKFLIAYALVLLLQQFLAATSPGQELRFFKWFALSNDGLKHGFVWQLLTYQFMHDGFLHLFFNGWAIYSFGLALESELGKNRFALLMLASGIFGGVLQSLVSLVWPQYFGGPVVGASACAFGLVAAFAVLHPNLNIQMLVFFVIPVTVTARILLIVSAAMALVGFGLHMDHVAHAAHLGGLAMGWFYATKIVPGFLRAATRVETEPEDPDSTKFTAREVDAVLDKISAQGINSLTAEERAVLEAARKKMSRS
jgi:membrane associated rhomboid family serine protease